MLDKGWKVYKRRILGKQQDNERKKQVFHKSGKLISKSYNKDANNGPHDLVCRGITSEMTDFGSIIKFFQNSLCLAFLTTGLIERGVC